MDYKERLEQVRTTLPRERRWWPNFFYHFTDVHNAAGIIESGWIYSRAKADEENIMVNDNASRVVIGSTNSDNKIYGRLYFRPLTPTQYHNEGFKPESVRDQDINASCPIPIFFLLSVEKTMEIGGVKFAEKGISGGRNNIKEGEEEFSNLNFAKIYHDGGYNSETDWDIKEYRQSEVIRDGGFPVPQIVRGIVCRSNAERETLLYLLRRYSLRLYQTYKKMIMYKPSQKMFYNNGVFIKEVNVNEGILSIELNSAYLRYGQKSESISFEVNIEITYLGEDDQRLHFDSGKGKMSYFVVEKMDMELEDVSNCNKILVKIMFDEAVMYENELVIADNIIW